LVDPETYLPPTFKIGLRYTRPLVFLPELKKHLKVLSGIEECLGRIKADAMRMIEEGQMSVNPGEKAEDENVMTPDVAIAAYLTLSAWEFDRWVMDLYRGYFPNGTSNVPSTTTNAGVADPTVTPFGARVGARSDPGPMRSTGVSDEDEDVQPGGWRAKDLPKSWGVIMVWHAYCLNPRCEW
jgi:hypothetical protein